MQAYGVSTQGKELELFPGLTMKVPFGAAYARDEDGDISFFMPRSTPRTYRDGPFELDDEAEMDWKLSSFRQVFSGTLEVPQAEAAGAVEEHMEEIAKGLTEDKDQSESDEDRYTFGTEEKEDGLTFRANFSTAQAGGSYEKPVTRGHVTLCVVHQRMRVMRFHITVSHLLVGVTDYPHMRYYLAGLGVPDEEKREEILQKHLFPLLYGLKFTAPPSLSDLLGKTPEELFPAAVRQLDFAAGEQVEAGEFTVTIPRGLHYTRTENPQTRFFTAIPQEIPFDAEDYWNYSAVALTLQTGSPMVNFHAPLNTAEGETEVKLVLKSLRVTDSSSAGQTEAGETTRAAWAPEYYICYELLDDNDADVNFRYYVFTKNFLYPGQYVGKKAGLGPDYLKIHTGILETYLKGFRYVGGSEKLLEDAGRKALGRFAGSNGRMDALKAVQLFNQDVLFFPEGTLTWDGKRHIYKEIHLNAEKQEEFPDIREKGQEIMKALQALIDACEDDGRIRVPAAKLGKDLRTFLKGADLTGAALFHLAAYHLFWFKELEEAPGSFQILVDTRLKNTVPDAENYFKRFLEILRAYNGDPAPVVPGPAVTFRAVDIPDIFEDGGPCLAEADEDTMLQTTRKFPPAAEKREAVPSSSGSKDLGRFAGADGRLDAFMAVHFFTEDVIFFHPEDLLWDGKHHSFANYRFNTAVLPNAEGVLEYSEAILEGLKTLIQEMEENPELRVPAEDLHPEMRRFLKGADFTPAVVFYMECFNFFRFWEEEPDKYEFTLEERLAYSFYTGPYGGFDYPYFKKFIGALRAYNGNHKPYTVSCHGTFGGQSGPHLPDIRVSKYELDEDGFIREDENGNSIYRQKTPEELAWEARMAKKAAEAELAKVPFDRVSSVTVSGSAFVLTGDFEKSPEDRDAVKRMIEARGGRCTGAVSGKTNYLVVGALGNFGQRKIEQVQEQRTKGKTIQIIREADLMAALEGRRSAPPRPSASSAPKPAPRPSVPRPAPSAQKASDEVEAKAQKIRSVLSSTPITAAEINAALGTDYTALQIANAVKLLSGVRVTKVIRTCTNAQGQRTDCELTAYCLDGGPASKSAPSPAKPAAKPSASRTLASEPGFRMEEIDPKDGESARFRVTVDLSSLLNGGGDTPAARPAPAPSGRKASDEVEAKAQKIRSVLSSTPITAAEINAALGTDYTALQIANAVRLLSGVRVTKVIRTCTNAQGQRTDRELTAYCLDGGPASKPAPSPAKPAAKPAPSPVRSAPPRSDADDAEERMKRQEEEAYRKALSALRTKVQAVLSGDDREAQEEIRRLQKELDAAREKRSRIGFFNFAEKKAAQAEINRLTEALSKARKSLNSSAADRRRRAENLLRESPLPALPRLTGKDKARSDKGFSAETLEKAQLIKSALSTVPMTAAEINAVLGTDYTALQIANAVKTLPVGMVNVLRIDTNARGEMALKEHRAYYLG